MLYGTMALEVQTCKNEAIQHNPLQYGTPWRSPSPQNQAPRYCTHVWYFHAYVQYFTHWYSGMEILVLRCGLLVHISLLSRPPERKLSLLRITSSLYPHTSLPRIITSQKPKAHSTPHLSQTHSDPAFPARL